MSFVFSVGEIGLDYTYPFQFLSLFFYSVFIFIFYSLFIFYSVFILYIFFDEVKRAKFL